MKILILLLGILNGGYMLADGVFVIIKGKYIGPDNPGPWSIFFEKSGIDPLRLGPMFVVFGLAWLVFVFGISIGSYWAYYLGVFVSVATLWYLPLGTVIAVFELLILVVFRSSLQQ